MFNLLSNTQLASALLLLLLSWSVGRKASRLIQGGSFERLHRKTRKLLVWTILLTIPSIAIIIVTLLMTYWLEVKLWDDRILMHILLVGVPLLGVWLLATPRLWKLLRISASTNGAPLPVNIRSDVSHPFIVVPFQAFSLGAVTLFYFAFVTPVPITEMKITIPLLIYICTIIISWKLQHKRWQHINDQQAGLSMENSADVTSA
ncbi:MAG: hypothetical protein P0Y55_15800 [Candidatus Cohnella colombiensis]|uniref:Uncharacterized protein n=1 Tax=Candidatus Cohnella colombiensis TaxID=3121368 RepID=A0AA95JBE9_9BACL|nr:MAG: hypothetical protein P0Y55_15800 [Cohnella sp.]